MSKTIYRQDTYSRNVFKKRIQETCSRIIFKKHIQATIDRQQDTPITIQDTERKAKPYVLERLEVMAKWVDSRVCLALFGPYTC